MTLSSRLIATCLGFLRSNHVATRRNGVTQVCRRTMTTREIELICYHRLFPGEKDILHPQDRQFNHFESEYDLSSEITAFLSSIKIVNGNVL